MRIRFVAVPAVLASFLLFSAASLASDRRHGDVDKIGNRNINGRIMGILPNMISLEKEVAIGSQLAMQFEQTARLIEDPVITEYVDRVGQNLVKKSDAKVPFHIKVVDTDEVNAFALPGGYFYVNKGLILESESEAELAGVMAHEISHVAARHATERLSKGQYLQMVALPAMILFGPAYGTLGSVALQNGLGLSIDLAILGITRKSEEEADQLGVQYLWNSGYDTAAFTSFFEKLLAKEKKKPGAFASFLRTHPPLDNRIQFSQEEARQLPGKPEYMVTSSDYDRVKARLIAIDNKQLLPSGGGKSSTGKPQLKRKTQTGEPDDKPTLKRKPTLKKDTPPDEPDKNPPSSPPPQ